MSKPTVDLVVEAEAWLEDMPDLAAISERAAIMALSVLPEQARDCEICVMACDDARIAELNGDFRAKPQPTNVLSWPSMERGARQPGGDPARPEPADMELGDVAIA